MLNPQKRSGFKFGKPAMACAIIGFLGYASISFGQDTPQGELAYSLHTEGKFPAAIEAYEAQLGQGKVNGHLFYNLGNAYYRNGEVGQAMAAFLAARRYLPRDPDVNANLKYVLDKIDDNITISKDRGVWGILGFWMDQITVKESAWMFATVLFMAGMFLLGSLLLKPLQGLQRLAWIGLLLPLGFALNFYASYRLDQPWGAVIKDQGSVRSGPSAKNKVVFNLNEGAPFVVTGQTPGWLRIALSDGKKGWISKVEGRALSL